LLLANLRVRATRVKRTGQRSLEPIALPFVRRARIGRWIGLLLEPRIQRRDLPRQLLGVAMLGALCFVLARRRTPPPLVVGQPASPVQDDDADRLAREIASLDSEFERQPSPSDDARASYEQRRDFLKRSLARALDARRSRA